jgi:predicted RNA-binding protein
MNTEELNKKATFKYNMSFYYQSTIIYFIVFAVYLIIRGEFVEETFTLITRDPIIYLLGAIVVISLVSLLYNIYKNKYVEISEDGISFVTRFGEKQILISQIKKIKITKHRERIENRAFRLVRIKLKNRRRSVIIRPYDYENEDKLLKKFEELKNKVEAV